MLAVILESGEPDRLYTALSLLVSTAAEGEPARGLLSFGALPSLIAGEVDPDLWATARELDIPLHACAAAGDPGDFPVISMPRFLKETAGARLVVV
jgi:peroxiredoxin family protein